MLALAFTVSSVLAALEARRQNIAPDIIFNLSFLVLVSGIIGARLFYVIENAGYYLKEPLEMVMLQRGGLSWFGGLIAGVISGVAYLKKKHLAVYKILDLLAPFVALGQAIGRIGCLLNGCCFGKAAYKFGFYFKAREAFLIPTQIYSSLLLLLIFIILRFLQDKPHKRGEIFLAYLFLYSLKRFFIEFWRADNPVIFFGLTLFQLISIVIFVFSAVKLVLIKYSKD
jgi:phosphatidylglycerol:prolipoprotein diacylglycerol transferase